MSILNLLLGHRSLARAWRRDLDQHQTVAAEIRSGLREQLAPRAENAGETWDHAIKRLGVTEAALRKQVLGRQLAAYGVLLIASGAAYVIASTGNWLLGLPTLSALIASYLLQAFRLFQIRRRTLCPFGFYLTAIRNNWEELLPAGLPPGWRIRS